MSNACRTALILFTLLSAHCGTDTLDAAPDQRVVGCALAQSRMLECRGDACQAQAGKRAYDSIVTQDGHSLYASVGGCVAYQCPTAAAYLADDEGHGILYGFLVDDCTFAAIGPGGPCHEFQTACEGDGDAP